MGKLEKLIDSKQTTPNNKSLKNSKRESQYNSGKLMVEFSPKDGDEAVKKAMNFLQKRPESKGKQQKATEQANN